MHIYWLGKEYYPGAGAGAGTAVGVEDTDWGH